MEATAARVEPDGLTCSSGGLEAATGREKKEKYALLALGNDRNCDVSLYDRPLFCFGCGIGWFCFVLGFIFPLLWYIATALYFGRYSSLRDPRERAGLAASAIAALIFSVAALITLLAFIL